MVEVVQSPKPKIPWAGPADYVLRPELRDHVQIKSTPEKASITVFGELPEDMYPSVIDLKYLLWEQGVVDCIHEWALEYIVEKKVLGEERDVAEQVLVENGRDGAIEELTPIPSKPTPKILSNGNTDYKNLNWNAPIKANEVIANRVDPTEGSDGRTIFGDVIKALPGSPIQLPAGVGTLLSDDGKVLKAVYDGYLYWRDGRICVGESMVIEGDVDYHTGNIKHAGELLIKGHVRSGFSVEAAGNIVVHGQVEGARVWSREANVEIRGGVFGKGKAEIHAHQTLIIEFAQEAKLFAGGTLYFNKFLMNCNTFAMGAIESLTEVGTVVGGEASTYQDIKIGYAGNSPAIHTVLSIQTPEADQLNDKWSEFRRLEKDIHAQVLTVASRLKVRTDPRASKQLHSYIGRENLAKQTAEYKGLLLRLKLVEKKKLSIEAELDVLKSVKGGIKVIHTAYAGTEIAFLRKRNTLKESVTGKVFNLINNDIISG